MAENLNVGEWQNGFQFILFMMMCGLSFHVCIHFFILPAATKLWDFWAGDKL